MLGRNRMNEKQTTRSPAKSAYNGMDKALRNKRIAVVVFTFFVIVVCCAVLVARFSASDSRPAVQPVISAAFTVNGIVLPASNVNAERTFDADSAADGDFDTCWCVNTESLGGGGAEIRFELEQKCIINGVMLVNGNVFLPEEDLFRRNGQVKNFTLTFSDGTTKAFTASYDDTGAGEYQYFYLDAPVSTEYVLLTVDNGYEGEKFPYNVCIAEFNVFKGNPPGQTTAAQEESADATEAPTEDVAVTQADMQDRTEPASLYEVYEAYMDYLKNAEYSSSVGQTCAEVEDIDGDDVPELLVSTWNDCTIVFAYDTQEKAVREVIRKEMGKGCEMTALYSNTLHRVVFPSASTGGEVYEVFEFTPTGAEQYLLLECENGKHSSSGEKVYMLDGRIISKGSYDVQLAVLRSTYKKIDTSVEKTILKLKYELGKMNNN